MKAALVTTQQDRAMQKPPIGKRVQAAWKSLWGHGSQYYMYGYRNGSWGTNFRFQGTDIDYRTLAGALEDSAVIMACVQWYMRVFPEARPRIMRREADGKIEQFGHACTELLDEPNPYFDGLSLWQSTIASYVLSGNAFWIKGRNSMGRVIRLWYEPHHTIRPAWPAPDSPLLNSEDGFITHYEVYRDFKWERLEKQDVVHFRLGQDPLNPRMGISPLASAARHIYTINEATNYTSTMLKNLGIIGMMVSPRGENIIDDPEDVKQKLMARTQGDHRGEPTVFDIPIDVVFPEIDTSRMNTNAIQQTPEAIICALIGPHPAVVGLPVGLEHSTYSNMEEAREDAYESHVFPKFKTLGSTVTRHVLREFSTDRRDFMDFDISDIRVIQEDEARKAIATSRLYDSGIMKRAEARKRHNLEAMPEDDVYKSGPNSANAPLEDALLLASSNGNGKTALEDLVTIASARE